MEPASNRSSIPVSFDRYRVRSIQLLSPFRNHRHEQFVREIPQRSRKHKSQIHPHEINSSKSEQINHDATYLFHANNRSNAKTSSKTKDSKNKKCSNKLFTARSTSNIVGVFDLQKLPVTDASRTSQPEAPECIYSSTPCIMNYRQHPLPTGVIKRPTSFDD